MLEARGDLELENQERSVSESCLKPRPAFGEQRPEALSYLLLNVK